MRAVAIVNQKGGCGKTTTAISLAATAARNSRRALLIDLDPQSHCALGLAVPEARIEKSVGDALLGDLADPSELDEVLWRAGSNLDLLPSSTRLAGLEAAGGGLYRLPDRDRRLARLLSLVADRYDYCVIDCPPHIGLLTYNALTAATDILIPVETSYFALQGAEKQTQTVQALAARLGSLAPYHLLPTMYDESIRLSREILDELRGRFGERVAPLVIRYCARLREAVSFGQPIVEYAPESAGRNDFDSLFGWLESQRQQGSRYLVHERFAALEREVGLTTAASASPSPTPTEAPTVETRPFPPALRPTPSPGERAAELARRAAQLTQRSLAMQMRLDADPAVRSVTENERGESLPPRRIDQIRRLYGARETAQGVLFVYPGLSPRQQVFVAGDFNDWSADATPMRFDERLQVFQACVPLPPGTYHYRLVIDGRPLADPYNTRRRTTEERGAESIVEVAGTPAVTG